VNSTVGALQVNMACTWDTFQNADEEHSNYFGSRLGKGNVHNAEGRKLIEFVERNNFEILNVEYGADTKGDYTSCWVGKSVIVVCQYLTV
jgi:hypothetical protein